MMQIAMIAGFFTSSPV
ncbi:MULTISPECIES: hypothetical protein [unclassified Bradyrhizobium]